MVSSPWAVKSAVVTRLMCFVEREARGLRRVECMT
jgi:hypothetical protein